MRQIKFRGKRLDNDEWVYGDLIHIDDSDIGIVTDYDHWQGCRVDPETVGQFSGLLDRNGKEIYEGDIVRYYDDIEDELVSSHVEYLADYCAFCAVHPKRDPDGIFAQWEYEVVGNIHDKKESDGED
jgi:uncharacterized phage protein (TIGR01671 family)